MLMFSDFLPRCGAKRMVEGAALLADEVMPSEPLAHRSGFSLYAGVSAGKDEQAKRERLCRYITRPAISEKRLSMTSIGQVRYQLTTPYRDVTTFVLFDPLDFTECLRPIVQIVDSSRQAGVVVED